jgi:hypothetical protein
MVRSRVGAAVLNWELVIDEIVVLNCESRLVCGGPFAFLSLSVDIDAFQWPAEAIIQMNARKNTTGHTCMKVPNERRAPHLRPISHHQCSQTNLIGSNSVTRCAMNVCDRVFGWRVTGWMLGDRVVGWLGDWGIGDRVTGTTGARVPRSGLLDDWVTWKTWWLSGRFGNFDVT